MNEQDRKTIGTDAIVELAQTIVEDVVAVLRKTGGPDHVVIATAAFTMAAEKISKVYPSFTPILREMLQ